MMYSLVALLFLSTGIVHSSRLPHVFNKLRVGRYPRTINFDNRPLRLHEKNQFYTIYENFPLRKNLRFDDITSLFPPKAKIVTDSLENTFDENGMILLTRPRNDEDRLLNELLNDVILYKAAKNERALRDGKRGVNRKESLKNVLRSNDNSNFDSAATPKLVFDFNEIVG
ncbi:unnamed protein product, partial [Iphiclides podalirius]